MLCGSETIGKGAAARSASRSDWSSGAPIVSLGFRPALSRRSTPRLPSVRCHLTAE
jgi:hypothetical protein